jgi:ABC-type Zn uptake system ZnuABC Zn-binding protein ZnuA
MVKNLAEYLAALDGGNADFYKQNAEKYIRELDALYTRFSEKFSQIEDKRLVSYPASYPYLFEEMGIVEVARGEETHGQEPSARRILTIADLMKKSGVKIIVSEKQFSSPLPSTLARETGGKIVYLSPLLLGGQTYLELMEANYNALLEGFAQN